jgi:aarF domain-containing kinase
MVALSPTAFLKLAEDTKDNEKTGEMQMLEVSRAEVRKTVPADAHGLSKFCQSVYVFWYCYVYDPIATGFRFLHLAVIFIPVVVTVPAIWLGRRVRTKNGARTGTIWWYKFLVNAMERAGPAFIKVSSKPVSTRMLSIINSD